MPFHPSHKLSLQTAKFLVVALRNAVAECPEITTWSGNLIVDDRDGNALGIRIDDLGSVTVTSNSEVVAKYHDALDIEPELVPSTRGTESTPIILDTKGISLSQVSQADHVHSPDGKCIKNRYGPKCN